MGLHKDCQQGPGTGISVRLLEAMGRPEGVTLPAKILKASLYCLLIKPGKPTVEGVYSEKWLLLIFEFLFRAHSPKQLEFIWLKNS